MEGPPKEEPKEGPKEEPPKAGPPRSEEPPREPPKEAPSGEEPPKREEPPRDYYRPDYPGRYGPPPYGPPQPHIDIGQMFTTRMIGMVTILGMILVLVGAMMATSSLITDLNPDPDDQEDARGLYKNSLYVSEIGLIVIAIPMLAGGLLNDRLDDRIRMALIVGGAIIVFGLFSAISGGMSLM